MGIAGIIALYEEVKTMSKIKIITDSTSYITKEYAEKNHISIVPLNYTLDGKTDKEGFPDDFHGFFNKLSCTNLFPTTSQPSIGDFLVEFEKAFSQGYEEIIAILLSSKLSGTYNSAMLAKDILEDKRITIIDSIQVASNLRFLVEDAVKMIGEGKTSEYIISHIEYKKHYMHVYFTVETLEYLKRGGRISSFQSAIGSVLNIKPIIELRDGELKLLERIRGKAKAIKEIINRIPKDVSSISICHILREEESYRLKTDLESIFPNADISIDVLGPIIGCHLGAGCIGICFY